MIYDLPQSKLQHTPGHLDCPACAGAANVIFKPLAADLLFSDAFELWISHHTIAANYEGNASFLAKRTIKDYRNCYSALSKFFGRLQLRQIHAGHLREYQRMRAVNGPDPAAPFWCVKKRGAHGPFISQAEAELWSATHGGGYELRQTIWAAPTGANRIRKEVGMLVQILKAAHCWGEAQSLCFRALRPVESDVPRAMDGGEEQRFLAAAWSRPEWHFIYYYAVLALRTTCSTNELRSLQLADVSLEHGYLKVRREGAKNPGRMRTIPLETEDVMHALEWLLERAASMGASLPFHYLFPVAEKKGKYDARRPMTESALKKRWDAVRQAAGLEWLRPYDLRHTAITRMAEAGEPIAVIMSFAGHLTLRMQQHYTSVSMMARRGAARRTWGTTPPKLGPHQERYGLPTDFLRRA